ncbi:MAG: NAD(P)H-hydrate dehydratase [Elusimicrobiota bacterium]|jgi:NAD(P)H-hydrate epimerase|nr:NAD(P)H-hydrate dehydratase [Elusimicrobiota bacterium]
MNKTEIKSFSSKLKRNPDSHKYDYGHILSIAGSKYMPGAGVLCCNAVLRCGAGLITHAIKDDFFQITASLSKSETIFVSYKTANDILDYIHKRRVSSLIIGPGLTESASTRAFIIKIISKISLPLILDASGLSSFAGKYKLLKSAKARLIITPHEGEFSKLSGLPISAIKQDAKTIAAAFAKENNLILILKRHNTIVTDGKQIYINDSGTPAMASAGSGDVLCGIIAAFCAKNCDLFEASKFAVWIHGLAGEYAQKEKGNCLIASDIIESIPMIISAISAAKPRYAPA